MEFLSPEVALQFYKSTIWLCMEYFYHVWADATGCYLELLYRLLKWVCRTVGPSLADSLEPLAHRRNKVNLVFSIDITLVDFHLNWLVWLHFLILEGGLLIILTDCMIFLLPFQDITRMSMSNASLSKECFPLTYDLNGLIYTF